MHAETTALHPIPDLPPALSEERAAEVAQRSVSWVRKRRRVGQLVATELDGRPAIETESLLRLMRCRPAARSPSRPRLALVTGTGPASSADGAARSRGHLRIAAVDGRTAPHP